LAQARIHVIAEPDVAMVKIEREFLFREEGRPSVRLVAMLNKALGRQVAQP
jgi:hypothetical protein